MGRRKKVDIKKRRQRLIKEKKKELQKQSIPVEKKPTKAFDLRLEKETKLYWIRGLTGALSAFVGRLFFGLIGWFLFIWMLVWWFLFPFIVSFFILKYKIGHFIELSLEVSLRIKFLKFSPNSILFPTPGLFLSFQRFLSEPLLL